MGRKLTDGASAAMTSGQPAKVMAECAPRQRGRLLVVDDDLCVREAMGLFFSEKGYTCITSGNAVTAIGHLEKNRFDLIITDLHMPDMDGMALLEWTKARWPTCKVMVITGDSDTGMQALALNKGADNYLMKPFTLDQLLREVDGCINGHRPGLKIYPGVLMPKPFGR